MGFLDRVKTWVGRRPSDGASVMEAPASGGSGAKRDPAQNVIKKIGLANNFDRDFVEPEFDLTEITGAYNTESYVRQAVDKYIESMFKAGWDLVGKNPNSVLYIRQRLQMMAEVTQIPNDQLFIEMAEDLVKYANVVVVKSRTGDPNAQPPGVTVQGLGGLPAVDGYFPVNVTTLTIKRDKNGTVKSWQQEVEGQDRAVTYKAANVVHIYYKREKGNAFGTPFLMPVLDDIRALRQAEENVLKLIYRNLFPYIHVQVGLPEEGLGATDPEIAKVQSEIENMDLEAGVVTSERVNIKPIANDKIIDANPYLKYFEQRVFTGLGVSELMMGRGNTANRSTGDNLSGEFADRVKAFQRVMAIFIDEFMIKELLMEGGFDPITNPDDDVDFIFKEIDMDAKIKAENHAIYQYEHNAITEDEMRRLLGRDPITERGQMFMELVTIATAKATAAATATTTATAGTPAANNKNKPTNQNGTNTSPKKTSASHDGNYSGHYKEALQNEYDLLNAGVNVLIRQYFEGNREVLGEMSGVMNYTENRMIELTREYLTDEEVEGIQYPLRHSMKYMHDTLVQVIEDGKGNESYERVVETANAVFAVLNDRFEEIADKACNHYFEGGEIVGQDY